MKIVWSERAVNDLSEIRTYIAEDSESRAIAVLERLIAAAEGLEAFPDRGRRVPEVLDLPALRELLVGSYRVIYRRESERIEIVMIVHGRRHLAGLGLGDL